MEYYIGIDAGGTKTEAALTDQTGHIPVSYTHLTLPTN